MNWEEIKAWLEANKDNPDVVAYFKVLQTPTLESVKAFLNTAAEGKTWFQQERDRHFDKGLETWKANNLETAVDEEVRKRHPSKTPEQIEVEKLRMEINNEKRERVKAELRNKLAGVLTEKKLPLSVMNRITSDTEEDALKEIDALATDFEAYAQVKVQDVLKEHGRDPLKGGGGGGAQKNPWSKEHFNLTEQGRIFKEDPQLAEQLKAAAKQ